MALASKVDTNLARQDLLGQPYAQRNNIKVSVIVPTLDEEQAIEQVLADIPRSVVDELVVVDGSADATAKIAEGFGARVLFEWRKGYGRALQSGIEKSGGDVVVYIDGDYSYDPNDIPRIAQPILNNECDVVLGNRLNGGIHPGAMSLLNRVGNSVLSLVFSVVFAKRVHDTQCGLRAIRKEFLKGNNYRECGMPYVTEQLIKLIKQGARIHNAPVTYRPRVGASKLSMWSDGFKILRVILRERLRRSIG
jgi:glycosyltransferase involved in cell wall biosynthesis